MVAIFNLGLNVLTPVQKQKTGIILWRAAFMNSQKTLHTSPPRVKNEAPFVGILQKTICYTSKIQDLHQTFSKWGPGTIWDALETWSFKMS